MSSYNYSYDYSTSRPILPVVEETTTAIPTRSVSQSTYNKINQRSDDGSGLRIGLAVTALLVMIAVYFFRRYRAARPAPIVVPVPTVAI